MLSCLFDELTFQVPPLQDQKQDGFTLDIFPTLVGPFRTIKVWDFNTSVRRTRSNWKNVTEEAGLLVIRGSLFCLGRLYVKDKFHAQGVEISTEYFENVPNDYQDGGTDQCIEFLQNLITNSTPKFDILFFTGSEFMHCVDKIKVMLPNQRMVMVCCSNTSDTASATTTATTTKSLIL